MYADEDDEEPTGDGTHSPDAKELTLEALRLRAERKGDADGRVYLVVVSARDLSGNVGFACLTIIVPKSNGGADIAEVESQAAAALTYCSSHGGAPPPGYVVVGDGPVIGPKQYLLESAPGPIPGSRGRTRRLRARRPKGRDLAVSLW